MPGSDDGHENKREKPMCAGDGSIDKQYIGPKLAQKKCRKQKGVPAVKIGIGRGFQGGKVDGNVR